MMKATLSAGGIIASGPCVYVLSLHNEETREIYIGRTGSSNGTGTSSPYKRLAKHLAKSGSTMSCIHDNQFPERFLESAAVTFLAESVPQDVEVHAERWLRWKFRSEILLNKDNPPTEEPELKGALKATLELLYKAAKEG